MLSFSRLVFIMSLCLLWLLSASTNGEETDNDIVYTDSLGQWYLGWVEPYRSAYGQDLLAMCFTNEQTTEGLIRIHVKSRDGLDTYRQTVFTKRTEFYESYFEPLKFFEYQPNRDTAVYQFFLLTEIEYGTGSYKNEAFYVVTPDGEVRDLPFRANENLRKPKLGEGESVKKSGRYFLCPDNLLYVYYIWNKGDGNCCPTAGRVSTTLEIFRDSLDGSFYMQPVETERVPYVHPVDEGKYDLRAQGCR